jgi:hypothetical protein
MSVSITVADLKHVRDLLTAYKAKDAFNFDEVSDVGNVFKNAVGVLKELGDDADDSSEVAVDTKDMAYMVQVMHVCALRKPMEIQNYGIIFKLFTTLSEAVKAASPDVEESKDA